MTQQKQPQMAQDFWTEILLCIDRADSSPIIIDQALAQANAVVTANGGAFGVTEDPAALDGHWSWSQMLDHAVGDSLHSRRRHWIHHAAIMSTKSPRSTRTFEEHATFDVLSTIQAHSAKHNRTDIVFNVCRPTGPIVWQLPSQLKRGREWDKGCQTSAKFQPTGAFVSETVREYDHWYQKKILPETTWST